MEGHLKYDMNCNEISKKETIICLQVRQLYRLLELLPGDDPTFPAAYLEVYIYI